MEYLKLLGILIVAIGFWMRFNPLLVVLVSGFITGLLAGISPIEILSSIGQAFRTNRPLALFLLILPMVGLLERYGLRERAEAIIRRIEKASAGRVMMLYLLFRQATSALGLPLNGHPSFIRPVVQPMAEAAATKGRLTSQRVRDRIRGACASSENCGNFFGQLLFTASPGLLLVQGVLNQAGYSVSLETMALYAIPTAIAAAVLAFARFSLFDRTIERQIQAESETRESREVAR